MPISDGSSAFFGVIATSRSLATEAAMGAFRADGPAVAGRYARHRAIRCVAK
ncbi:hypothetical protein [Mycolicibacterium nivoides]|uniref:hypothetical protein n=1 Tax=Mycolicibacterium nivoides TaxID=2487344 RepID=UPI0013DDC8AD|nr:hypothetical protein [Mycolicibacterium nivoides]MBN3510531.1 hypothetical protein [Mycolicibacterium septicum]QRY46149.1 hypothetical protein JVX93_04525 [Mycolicibacterium boenickei]